MTSSVGKRIAVVVPAAGYGRRIGGDKIKTLVYIGGAPMIRHAVRPFQEHPAIERICLVVRESDCAEIEQVFSGSSHERRNLDLVKGGSDRQESVWLGIAALESDPPDWVLVHDGARPCCTSALLDRVIARLAQVPAVVPVIPIHDTVRRIEGGDSQVLERVKLFRCQTPQGFHWETLRGAHLEARRQGLAGTDDAQLVEACGQRLEFVDGEIRNLKITTPADLPLAEWIVENPHWGTAEGGAS